MVYCFSLLDRAGAISAFDCLTKYMLYPLSLAWFRFTSEVSDIEEADIYIVTVPTPIDAYKRPDLTPLIKAS